MISASEAPRLAMASIVAALFLTASCVRSGPLPQAKSLLKKGRCAEAAKALSSRAPLTPAALRFARRAAKFCASKKKWRGAALFYEILLNEERDPSAAREIQKALAFIAGEKLKNCPLALRHYEALSQSALSSAEKFWTGLKKAECFLKTEKKEQALWETEQALSHFGAAASASGSSASRGASAAGGALAAGAVLSRAHQIQAVLMKARLLSALRRYDQALSFLQKAIREHPDKSPLFRRERAFIFEKRRDLQASLSELEKIRPQSPFLERKMQALRERIKAAPLRGRL